MIEKYGHGGDLRTASELYGTPPGGWLDFSANMNPFGPPPAVEEIFKKHWRDIERYPDPAVRGLTRKLAEKYGVPADAILVGNGAAEMIDLTVRALRPRAAVLARPCFSEYEEALRRAGSRVIEFALPEERGFVLDDIARFAAAVPPDAHLFLGNPNNPTGRLVPPAALRELKTLGAGLILDEAFLDFVPDEEEITLIREAAGSERLVVIRSMTKFYAVPGIRLGFMAAHPKLIGRLRAMQVPWSVNALAQRIGEAVLDDGEYAAKTRAWLGEERPWLEERLRSLGLTVVPGDVNFVLAALPAGSGWNAKRLQRELARRGVLIRDASLFPGLDERYFRVAVRLRRENEMLLAELGRALAGGTEGTKGL
jgi:threonine-phosphate decarboxylase